MDLVKEMELQLRRNVIIEQVNACEDEDFLYLVSLFIEKHNDKLASVGV